MISKGNFIKATEEYNTFEKVVPAYYFRRSFVSEGKFSAKISVAVCGFYKLYINGRDITKGYLSPYISNTNDYIYYDEYDIKLECGENVIGLILGNGFQNNPGGHRWDFDKADFRSAPMLSLSVTKKDGASEDTVLESDTRFKIAPSPIRSDDYRFGEFYDANFEIADWNKKGFDDSKWSFALPATPPKGGLRFADVSPITKEKEITPVEIIKSGDGYIYDFGESNAGVCRLRIKGKSGQKVSLCHTERMKDGDVDLKNVCIVCETWERDSLIAHRDTYICRGDDVEIYQPSFTYHGFRYVRVDGITEAQATPELLTYMVYHTELNSRGDFSCSDKMTNTLQEITRRSILSNFYHFPTDCPQREKNGWTADAALSCEAALINFDPERNYREWLRNICKAQNEKGALPGIVPTAGWGFHWGNGPAWDSVLAYIPYFVYIYRGEMSMITESSSAFIAYLRYLRTRCDEKGLLSIGLGDWCHVGRSPAQLKAPLILTDTVMSMDIASKMAIMFEAVGMQKEKEYALGEAEKYRSAIRSHLIDFNTMLVFGDCQSCQAMCLYYGVFEKDEEQAAFDKLLDMIHDFDCHIDVGVLGGRVIFHVLSKFGYSDLAFKMITREDYPSYGNWVKRGATTLWENFSPDSVSSMNHHFWGDISAFFIKRIVGICLNPEKHNINTLKINPHFIEALDNASAYHIAPSGKISVAWQRVDDGIILSLDIPEGLASTAELEDGYCFEGGESAKAIVSGAYRIIKK